MNRRLLQLLMLLIVAVLFSACSKKVIQYEHAPQPSLVYDRQPSPSYEPPPSSSKRLELMSRVAELEQKKSSLSTFRKSVESEDGAEELQESVMGEVVGYLDNPDAVNLQAIESPSPEKVNDVSMPPAAKRMVTYTGEVTTRSTNPDSLLQTAEQLVKLAGGFVERRYQQSITLRIPAPSFAKVYDSLLTLGEIISFSKFTEDITDAFSDADRRIQILEQTIARYIKLLPLVEKETGKIALLKDIEALREELELLKVKRATLLKRAEYATIHFTVEGRETGFRNHEFYSSGKGFEWINKLSPFYYKKFGGKQKFRIPEGMVRIKKLNQWSVQSPGGTRLWSGRIKNKPRGNENYWIEALLYRLKDTYQNSELETMGDYHGIWFSPHPGVNYRYAIWIKVVKDKIHVIQCYYPNQEQVERYRKAVENALKGKTAS